MGHAFVGGMEVVSAVCPGCAEDFTDAILEQGGGTEEGIIEKAGFSVGLFNTAEGAKLAPRKMAEGGGAANDEGGQHGREKKHSDKKRTAQDDPPETYKLSLACRLHLGGFPCANCIESKLELI